MELTLREVWTVLHGMGFGALFLLAFGGGLAGLYSLRADLVTPHGAEERARRLTLGLWLMSVVAWATVFSGTWIVYVWYRAKAPAGADLAAYPKAFLISKKSTEGWHEFGMEWKEHVAWIVPLVATSVAAVVCSYGGRLTQAPAVRKAEFIVMLILAFGAAAVAGVFGAFMNKVAATR